MTSLSKLIQITCAIFFLSSCSTEKDRLTEMIEDSWNDIEGLIEDHAEEELENLADNPEILYSGNCETDYISLGSIFTLRIPIDNSSYAAVRLLFGSDAADFLSLIDDNNRNSKSKAEIRKIILKHFNPSWAQMMTALIILDGEFDYDFETSSWMDASYDFDSKALYKILDEKGYFEGGYGETISQ